MSYAVAVRPCDVATRALADAFLAGENAARAARGGDLVDATAHPALVAVPDPPRPGEPALLGVLTYIPAADWSSCEVLTLHAAERFRGIGTALLDALAEVAAGHGCAALWLVTTNDNVDALRFYQRRGFRLRAIRPGAVDRSRERLKPEIPVVGDHGIPLRDELELVRYLASGRQP